MSFDHVVMLCGGVRAAFCPAIEDLFTLLWQN